jgi:23S rRNA (cytidine1920-2'-O)/16S rRNA (cytidine1409-2'-O)-methyltransferase
MPRRRADLMVVEQGLADSRNRAQALILAGVVLDIHGHRVEKPGELLADGTELHLKDQPLPYVSRGGLKLAAGLDAFAILPQGRICLDVGASTGGFTDCLLQRGATRVYAVDVGYGQMAWSIRQDPRVVVIERTNIRHVPVDLLPERPDLAVIDVSFISLKLVLANVLALLETKADLVALVKPQFEVGRERVGKGGIVRDALARERAVSDIALVFGRLGLGAARFIESPIHGTDGNVEYLMYGKRTTVTLPA